MSRKSRRIACVSQARKSAKCVNVFHVGARIATIRVLNNSPLFKNITNKNCSAYGPLGYFRLIFVACTAFQGPQRGSGLQLALPEHQWQVSPIWAQILAMKRGPDFNAYKKTKWN